jgi:hypothetical protein
VDEGEMLVDTDWVVGATVVVEGAVVAGGAAVVGGGLVVRVVDGASVVVGETVVDGAVVVDGVCEPLDPPLAMTRTMTTITMMARAATAAPIHLPRPLFWGR